MKIALKPPIGRPNFEYKTVYRVKNVVNGIINYKKATYQL